MAGQPPKVKKSIAEVSHGLVIPMDLSENQGGQTDSEKLK
jgi:hypothetical protein